VHEEHHASKCFTYLGSGAIAFTHAMSFCSIVSALACGLHGVSQDRYFALGAIGTLLVMADTIS